MDNQKNVLWLARFELKHSVKNLGLLIPILILVIFLIRSSIPNYLTQPTMGLEMMMLITITYFSQVTRPKGFQLQKRNGVFYASPFIIALNQLGVPQKLIVKYRLLTYFIIHSLFISLLFIGLYASFQDVLPVSTYIIFAFLWYCIGIYIGMMTPAFEAATNLAINIAVSLLIAPILLILNTLLFYKTFQGGFVGWTMYISAEYPIWTVVISLLLAIVGWNFWQKRMMHKMKRVDYL